jgi:hypothetical protein
LKRSCSRKKAIFQKFHNDHHIKAIEEHVRVFLFGLVCKKKSIVRSTGEGAQKRLAHSPTAPNEQICALNGN